MSVTLHRPSARRASESGAVDPTILGPVNASQLQIRREEIARCRPAVVAGILEHWLNTPQGESHFDVKS